MDAKPREDEQSAFGIADVLSAAYGHNFGNRNGALANYIPELAAVDPSKFGIAIATEGGKLHTVGDADHAFTIQSVSKAFVYCLA